ncbi:MAG: beta-galactosidase [Candidatus Falkowbacteria bacterium]|nr:beta-galactosidase [Candidatus Falkowbacteria bacterium]
MKKTTKIIVFIVSVTVFILIYNLKVARNFPSKIDLKHKNDFFGVTFSKKFCGELGLDWKEVYAASLKELQVKQIRIPIYWDDLEKTEGAYDFTDYDYLVSEGQKEGAKFIISMGRRVPRWPECHSPAWLNTKSAVAQQVATLKMVTAVTEHYKKNPSVVYWQVENEPFLGSFGVCPVFDENFFRMEVERVRNLDNRKIIVTGSGELGWWREEASIGDYFGTTMYRVVYNSWFGFLRYPVPAEVFYNLKAKILGVPKAKLMVIELQAEPWVPEGSMMYLTQKEIDKSMSVDQFKANLQGAINLDFSKTYLWGVEWWYWQKKYGNPEYWQIAAKLFD